jgi:hypothetical protein
MLETLIIISISAGTDGRKIVLAGSSETIREKLMRYI